MGDLIFFKSCEKIVDSEANKIKSMYLLRIQIKKAVTSSFVTA